MMVDRVAALLARAERRRMFGGQAFFAGGNMLVCVRKDESLMVRVGAADYAAALAEPGVGPCDGTGRPMRGWVVVQPAYLDGDALAHWVERASAFVATLPPKGA